MHKWYVSLLDAVRVFADAAIIKIPNIEKITNKIISNYTNIFYRPPASYIEAYLDSQFILVLYKTLFFCWEVYSGDAIKEIDSVGHKTMREIRSSVRRAAPMFSQTKNDVFKGSAAFQVSHLNNLESLSLE